MAVVYGSTISFTDGTVASRVLYLFVKLGRFRAPWLPRPAVDPWERRIPPLGLLQRLPLLPRRTSHVSAAHPLRCKYTIASEFTPLWFLLIQDQLPSSSLTRAAAWSSLRRRISWAAAWRSVMTTPLCRPWAGWRLKWAPCMCSVARKSMHLVKFHRPQQTFPETYLSQSKVEPRFFFNEKDITADHQIQMLQKNIDTMKRWTCFSLLNNVFAQCKIRTIGHWHR